MNVLDLLPLSKPFSHRIDLMFIWICNGLDVSLALCAALQTRKKGPLWGSWRVDSEFRIHWSGCHEQVVHSGVLVLELYPPPVWACMSVMFQTTLSRMMKNLAGAVISPYALHLCPSGNAGPCFSKWAFTVQDKIRRTRETGGWNEGLVRLTGCQHCK